MSKKLKTNYKIKIEAFIWMLLSYALFYLLYNFASRYSSQLSNVPSSNLNWEINIPFIEWMILPYLSSGIFFCAIFFLHNKKSDLYLLVKRINFITIISVVSFLLFPLKFEFAKPSISNSFFKIFFNLLETIDNPYNQFPSLHISYGIIFIMVIQNKIKGYLKWALQSWIFLLLLSTLTIYQHHFIDIPGGIMVSLISLILFPEKINNERKQNILIGKIYFLISLIFLLLTIILPNHFIFLLYPFFTLLVVGMAYFTNNPNFLKKKNGAIPWFSKLFFAPYLISCWLMWKLSTYGKKPVWSEIIPKVYIGRRLNKKDALKFKKNNDVIIFDLAPEIDENPLFINEKYFYYPILDISNPLEETIKKAQIHLKKIIANKKENEIIYIHCTMGYSRSALLAAAFLKEHQNTTTDEIISLLRKARPQTILPLYLQKFI